MPNNSRTPHHRHLKEQSESGEWKDVDGVDLSNLREHLQKQT